ncbi:MAG: helix-turn-helix domain-containing protein [Oligoflexales bacterium]|nr:helix-turn-helix domain-containing protein [Oligoflexales bacterium]
MDQQEKAYKVASTASGKEDSPIVKDYYEVLNVEKDASFKEIREAFFRLKNTYNSNNQALYSLLEEDDLEESIEDINEAYAILSNAESRVNYDRELVDAKIATESQVRHDITVDMPTTKSQSIGGQRSGGTANSTWTHEQHIDLGFVKEIEGAHSFHEEVSRGKEKRGSYHDVNAGFLASPRRRYGLGNNAARKAIAPAALQTDIQEKVSELIADGDLGDGNLYKRIRQLVGVSKEEMQDHIKVSIGYIDHLEENRFDLLPQPVYVKGFLKSYLRFLGISACDHLIKAYAERLNDWIEKKSS